MAVRKVLALIGAIAFPIAGFAAIAPAFRAEIKKIMGDFNGG